MWRIEQEEKDEKSYDKSKKKEQDDETIGMGIDRTVVVTVQGWAGRNLTPKGTLGVWQEERRSREKAMRRSRRALVRKGRRECTRTVSARILQTGGVRYARVRKSRSNRA